MLRTFQGFILDFQYKSVQKSVRFRPVIYDYIMTFPGKNFSEKLENLIVEHENQDQSV